MLSKQENRFEFLQPNHDINFMFLIGFNVVRSNKIYPQITTMFRSLEHILFFKNTCISKTHEIKTVKLEIL